MRNYLLPFIIISLYTLNIYPQNPGDLDNTFGVNGKDTISFWTGDDWGESVAVQSDGKILVGGSSMGDFALVRYHGNGSLDLTFGTGGKVTISIGTGASILSLKIQPDGKIVGAGFANVSQYQIGFVLARFNPDGNIDGTFGNGGTVSTVFGNANDYGRALAIQEDGKLLVTGDCSYGFTSDYSTVRYNTDGTLDNSFGIGGIVITNMGNGLNMPKSITVQSDGKIIVVGLAEPISGMVRYKENGSLDSTFGTGGKVFTSLGIDSYQSAVVEQPDNKIVVVGHYRNNIIYSNAVFRYNSDGSPDNSFGSAGISIAPTGYSDFPVAVILQQNGDIVIAATSQIGAWNLFELMKFTGNGSVDSSFGFHGMVQTSFNNYDKCAGLSIQPDGKLVAAGSTNDLSYGVKFATARYFGDGPLFVEIVKQESFELFPNPAKNIITIASHNSLIRETRITVFSINGEMLLQCNFRKQNRFEINVSDLTTGVYFVRIQSDSVMETKKLVIQ
jgi:uncharacterized delta-60 repeat protein